MPTCITRAASPPVAPHHRAPPRRWVLRSDGAGEAVGDVGPSGDGGGRFAGLSGLEKQGSRDGASAEQGSSFRVEEERQDYERDQSSRRACTPHTDFSQTSATAQQV